jgi:repressor LexA
MPLTDQQKKTLFYIINHIDNKGFPPTIPEIQEKLGFRNPGYVHKILLYLEKKGYIIRKKGEHRSIRLTELSEDFSYPQQLPLIEDKML